MYEKYVDEGAIYSFLKWINLCDQFEKDGQKNGIDICAFFFSNSLHQEQMKHDVFAQTYKTSTKIIIHSK